MASGHRGLYRQRRGPVDETAGAHDDAGDDLAAFDTLVSDPHPAVSFDRYDWPLVEYRSVHDFTAGCPGAIWKPDHRASPTGRHCVCRRRRDHDDRFALL